jgi:hypothetical protein
MAKQKMITRVKRINHVHVYEVVSKEGEKPEVVDRGIVDLQGTFRKESGIRRAVIAETGIKDPTIGEAVPEEVTYAMPEDTFFAQAKPVGKGVPEDPIASMPEPDLQSK